MDLSTFKLTCANTYVSYTPDSFWIAYDVEAQDFVVSFVTPFTVCTEQRERDPEDDAKPRSWTVTVVADRKVTLNALADAPGFDKVLGLVDGGSSTTATYTFTGPSGIKIRVYSHPGYVEQILQSQPMGVKCAENGPA
jgi:hypothetical protein